MVQSKPDQTLTKPDRTGSTGLQPLATAIERHRRPGGGGPDRAAIAAAMVRLADELGDRATAKASLTRTMNLFDASGISRDAFIDLLHLAKGEVRDRRQHPGKAPLPRNQMAYFFAVVEDRLGLREQANGGGGE